MKYLIRLTALFAIIIFTMACSNTNLVDCIDNCYEYGGVAIQSQDVVEQPCLCNCSEGYTGDLCAEFVPPIGFQLEQINFTFWSSAHPASEWDSMFDSIAGRPDLYFRISIADSLEIDPEYTVAGNTEVISNLDYFVEATLEEGVLPILLPYKIPLLFSLNDQDSNSNFEFITAMFFGFNSNSVEEGDTIVRLSNFGTHNLELKLIGDWVY